MYFPYLRGKTFELGALKEVAPNLNPKNIAPIIEPVQKSNNPLKTTIIALNAHGVIPHIILNPEVGELTSVPFEDMFEDISDAKTKPVYVPCIRITKANANVALTFVNQLHKDNISFSLYIQEMIDFDISGWVNLSCANIIKNLGNYPSDFANSLQRTVLVNAPFPKKDRNADYPEATKYFSDAHLTYTKPVVANQMGFGDFLIITDKWDPNGGPAYVVALHLTYISNKDSIMYIKHCKSTSDSKTQSNTAKKFQEALAALVAFANGESSVDKTTLGYKGLESLVGGPLPHLGVPKKLSMMHHMETLSKFIG
ncbi:sce7725 family protein [Vibrio fluvialis]|uniref:sce7725 family protein n=1 Tax=Vibrio fluvialis TaxID=676 RepID=UPI001F3CC7E7|nr:sce7725 family protein [Vibrio fluvialis]MCE7625502.1 sce7725 family protein [Vibrio fluvialis]